MEIDGGGKNLHEKLNRATERSYFTCLSTVVWLVLALTMTSCCLVM